MKAKITSTVFGGLLKPISSDAKIDLEQKEIILPDGVKIGLEKTLPFLYKLRGKEFYKKVGKTFFFPVVFGILLILWAINLLIGGDINIFLKIFFLISPISVIYYGYEVGINAERRSWIKDTKRKVLLVPFGILAIGVTSSLFAIVPGFAVSALLFSAMAAFFLEEYAIKDLQWIMSDGVSFWKPSLIDAPDQEKRERYQNIEKFLLVIEANGEH
ncbi:MAG: hypothetical protein PHT07_09940 [Paludibacter sp.]|nr:hypothetical protein [Paludibacter sp.]